MSQLNDFFTSTPGSGIGGLSWSVVATDVNAVSSAGYMFDNSAAPHTMTLPGSPAVGNTVGYKDLNGSFKSFPLTITGGRVQGIDDNLVIDTNNAYGTLTYSGATRGWVLTASSPSNPVVGKPMMHVQDQKPSTTSGGTNIAGTQIRILNTVLVNDIAGASLGSNQITLPAGEYLFSGSAPAFCVSTHKVRLYNVLTSQYIADGTSEYSPVESFNGNAQNPTTRSFLNTKLTFSSNTVLEFRHYTSVVIATSGLGVATSSGSEVYADLQIWKLDSDRIYNPSVYQPINQPISGAYTTGGIYGGELEYSTTTSFNVKPFSCMADDLTTPLFINSTTLVTLVSPVLNTIYHAWAVKYNTGAYGVKVDTDINGANLGATVVAKRRLGFVITNASVQIMPFRQVGDRMEWNTSSRPMITSSLTNTYAQYGMTIPSVLFVDIQLYQTGDGYTSYSYDGVTNIPYGTSWNTKVISCSQIYLKHGNVSVGVGISSVTLRR